MGDGKIGTGTSYPFLANLGQAQLDHFGIFWDRSHAYKKHANLLN